MAVFPLGDRAMHLIAFDTLKAQNKLVKTAMLEEQARAYVEILADVARIDIENVATKDYIDARLEKLEAMILKELRS